LSDPSDSSLSLSKMHLAAERSADEWRRQLLTTLWAVMKGNKGVYKKFKREWKALFDDPSEEELVHTAQVLPVKLRWWEVRSHVATEKEALQACEHCGGTLNRQRVKVCPECQVILHTDCFETQNNGYQTPNCECCRLRILAR
jgi:uncharacterized protein YigA (DUF484 family)